MFLLRAIAVWLILMVAETIHGTVRTLFLAPWIGEFSARRVGVVTGSLLIFGITLLLIRGMGVN